LLFLGGWNKLMPKINQRVSRVMSGGLIRGVFGHVSAYTS